MSEKQMTNGDMPQSKTVEHVKSYPLVNDLISTYSSNPYGQKSISTVSSVYQRLYEHASPFLGYLKGPYSYVAPYLSKADDMGDGGLKKIDERFPIVKEDSEKVKTTIYDLATFPFKLAGDSRDYVLKTYDDEYGKVGGKDGSVFKFGKAVVSTELKVASDALHVVADWLGPKKEAAEKEMGKLRSQAAELKKQAAEKVNGGTH